MIAITVYSIKRESGSEMLHGLCDYFLAPEMLKRGEKGVEGRSNTTTTTHARAEKKTTNKF